MISVLYNMFYVPFSICFDYDLERNYLFFDILLSSVINFIDIFIHARTAFKIRLFILLKT